MALRWQEADTPGVGWLGTRAFAVVLVLVASTLAAQPSPAAGQVPLLVITEVTGPPVRVTPSSEHSAQAACPDGQTPISGYLTASAGGDVRRVFETYGTGPGGIVQIGAINFEPASQDFTVTARCVPSEQLGAIHTVSGVFDAAADNVAEGTVQCPSGTIAINANVTEPSSPERTLLTTSPAEDLTGWTARGWVGNPDDPDEVMTIDAHCVAASALPGIQSHSHFHQAGWGAPASAECPTGLLPAFGGTTAAGDRGAITVHSRPTATGWASTTLSLEPSTFMLTTVACVPSDYPVLTLSGSSGITNVPSLHWEWSASDPAAAGGYSIGYTCTFLHAGVGTLPRSCTSPRDLTDLADGLHRIRVTAQTSDGRESTTEELNLVVDTVGPTVTMSKPPIFHLTRSASPTWTGQDATTGVGSYQLRRRRTPLVGDPGPWSTPVTLPPTATTRTFTDLLPGSTYCYQVRGTDLATNIGAWTMRCTAIALDDRALTRSAGWTDTTIASWLDGTGVETTTQGATLTRSATTRRIALTALRCPNCGVVGVFVDGTQVGIINLAAATAHRRTIPLPAFPVATGPVRLEVLSSGKLVRIDALSLTRH